MNRFMREIDKNRNGSLTAVLLFIAGTAFSLQTTAPFFGWGAGPEYGYASMFLKRASFFGYPLTEIAGKISSFIPTNSVEFSTSLLFAVLFGLTLVFIYSAILSISKSATAGVAGALIFSSLPLATYYFRSCTPESWSIFLAAALFASAAYHFGKPSNKSLLLVAFITGAGAYHNELVFLLGISAVFASLFMKSIRIRPAVAFASLLIIIAFSIQSAFLFLRPPSFIDWTKAVPSWMGVTVPMKDFMDIFLSGVIPIEIPYKLYGIAQCISGPFLPITAIAVIGVLFYRKNAYIPVKALWYAIIPALIVVLVFNHATDNVNTAILMMLVFSTGSIGAALIVGQSFNGKTSSFIAGGIACLILSLPPVLMNYETISKSQTKNNPTVLFSYLKNMRRDALFVIDSEYDPLYGIYYIQDCRGIRRDVTAIDIKNLFEKKYREYTRDKHRHVLIPTEKKYNELLEQLTGLMPTSKKEINEYLKSRIKEGLSGTFGEYIVFNNYSRSIIYFNRIDLLINSKIYPLMQFMPEDFLFRLYPAGIEKLFKLRNDEADKKNRINYVYLDIRNLENQALKTREYDKETKNLIAIYYENIGENFYLQERYTLSSDMMEACSILDPLNIQCRFFLAQLYKYRGLYEKSEHQYITAANLIKKKQLSGKHESSDVFMLERIYSELNQTDKAQKYRKLVKPEGEILPPGYSRPQ